MLKRSIAGMTLALVLLSASACGTQSPPANQPESSGAAAEEAAAEIREYSMFIFKEGVKAYEWDNKEVLQAITAKTGVKLAIEFNTGDYEPKVAIMLSSGDYPDIIYAGEMGNSLQSFIDNDMLLPLDDLVREHAPNIQRVWGESFSKLRNPADGKVYYIGGTPRNQQGDIIDANQCLLIQYDVLEKTGYPRINTLDDLYGTLETYLRDNKDLNGAPFTPFGLWTDSWGYNITINNPALWINGFTDDSDAYVDPDTYEIAYFNRTDYFKTYLQFLNRLYNADMIDQNAFITKNDQYISLVSGGTVLAMIDGTWEVAEAEAAMRQAGMPERCYARFPIVKDSAVRDRSQLDCESYTRGVTITDKCADPVDVIKFFDFCASDEGTILLNWGIEGTHYNVVDGVRALTEETKQSLLNDPNYKRNNAIQFFTWGQFGGDEGLYMSQVLSDGDYAAPIDRESPYNNGDEWTRKVMDQYGIKNWGQMFDTGGEATPYGYAWTININPDSKGSLARQKADEYRHAFVPTIVMSADEADFEANWQAFVSELTGSIGIESWEREMTDALAERVELWEIK